MALVLRAALILLATVPLFVATNFRLPLWQTLVAAAIGSGLGQLALVLTRARPGSRPVLAIATTILLAAIVAFQLRRPPGPFIPHRMIFISSGDRAHPLSLDDATALQALPEVAALAPVERSNEHLAAEDSNWMAQLLGTTPAVLGVRGWHVARGAPFSEEDVSSAAKVLILGPTTATSLFEAADPVGLTVRLKGRPFTVVGVLAPTGDVNTDDVALMPLTTYERVVRGGGLPGRFPGTFQILPRVGASVEPLRALLRARRHLAPGDEDDFTLRDVGGN